MTSIDKKNNQSRKKEGKSFYVVLDKATIVAIMIGGWSTFILFILLRWEVESGVAWGFAFGVSTLICFFWFTTRQNKKEIMEDLT